jgi:hypothetical protein
MTGNRGQVTFPSRGHVVSGLLVAEGQRQEECGQKTVKTRWVANDNGKKPSDYGVTCWFEGGNGVLNSGPEFKKGECEIQICTSTDN